MDNKQIISPDNYYGPVPQPQAQKHNKKLIIIFSIAAVVVIGLILTLFFIIRGNQAPNSYVNREDSPIFQIYATLDDEVPLQDLEGIAKKINSNVEVEMDDDGYGTIEIAGNYGEFISFYFNSENNNDNEGLYNEEDEEDADWLEEDFETTDYVEEARAPGIAYDFTYIYTLDGGDNQIYISKDGGDTYRYYDTINIYDFPTKQDAINAYLSTTLED